MSGVGRTRRLAGAAGANLVLAAGLLAGGIVAHSSALLADGGHDLIDGAGIVLSALAVHLALRAPTAKRSYGLHRATILTALANAVLIAIVMVLVIVHSVAEIRHVGPVNGVLLAILGGGALMVNVATALVTHEHHGADLNVRAVTLHLAGDGLASAAVAVAGIVIAETGRFMILDPAVALAIALLIALQGWRVAKEGIEILLEATPVDVDLVALVRTISAVTGVEEVHDLHCWSISSEVRALSAHLVLAGHPSLEQAQSLGEQVKQVICAGYAIQHTTLELECERCLDGTDDPCGIAELPAPPRRGGQPDPVPLGSRRGGNDAPTR